MFNPTRVAVNEPPLEEEEEEEKEEVEAEKEKDEKKSENGTQSNDSGKGAAKPDAGEKVEDSLKEPPVGKIISIKP